MNIGDNIRRMRRKKGLSQKQLGELLKMSPVMISQYENGKRTPKYDTLVRFSSALKCPVTALIDPFPEIHNMGFSSGSKKIIGHGYLAPDVSPKELNEHIQDLPFEVVNDFEKLIIYYNSLNDSGKDRLFEYLELLLDSPKYRNKNVDVGPAPVKDDSIIESKKKVSESDTTE